jgi:hypothetical protein
MPPLDKAHQLERRARTIVESLQGTWSRGKGMCCCPAHDDRTPSLSVTLGRKAILFHCFAGCRMRTSLRHWIARAFAAATFSMAQTLVDASTGKIRATSVPMRGACGNRRRRSPTALPNDTSRSAVFCADPINSVTWRARRSGRAALSNFSPRCWPQSRPTSA